MPPCAANGIPVAVQCIQREKSLENARSPSPITASGQAQLLCVGCVRHPAIHAHIQALCVFGWMLLGSEISAGNGLHISGVAPHQPMALSGPGLQPAGLRLHSSSCGGQPVRIYIYVLQCPDHASPLHSSIQRQLGTYLPSAPGTALCGVIWVLGRNHCI